MPAWSCQSCRRGCDWSAVRYPDLWTYNGTVGDSMAPNVEILLAWQAFWMLQSIIAGGFYFDEFAELSGWRAAAFSGGLLAAIAGAVGMGCASFVAEQHVMISYTILPGAQRMLSSGIGHSSCRIPRTLHMVPMCAGGHGLSGDASVASRVWDGRRLAAGPHATDGLWPAVCRVRRTHGAHRDAAPGLEPPQVDEVPDHACGIIIISSWPLRVCLNGSFTA